MPPRHGARRGPEVLGSGNVVCKSCLMLSLTLSHSFDDQAPISPTIRVRPCEWGCWSGPASPLGVVTGSSLRFSLAPCTVVETKGSDFQSLEGQAPMSPTMRGWLPYAAPKMEPNTEVCKGPCKWVGSPWDSVGGSPGGASGKLLGRSVPSPIAGPAGVPGQGCPIISPVMPFVWPGCDISSPTRRVGIAA